MNSNGTSPGVILHLSAGPDGLKTKMSELRLYCDLLVQQVQTIQTQYTADTEAPPTVEVARLLFSPKQVPSASLKDFQQPLCSCAPQASLLSATCYTFIRTLEECMTLANQSLTPDLRPTERVTALLLSGRSILQP